MKNRNFSIAENLLPLLRCSLCGGRLSTRDAIRKGFVGKGLSKATMVCEKCTSSYALENGIPNMLPPRIKECWLRGISVDEARMKGILRGQDLEILEGMIWSGKMAPAYHENVADPVTSVRAARQYERYEDLYLDSVLEEALRKGKVIFIELGSGTGRYLIRFGSRMVKDRKAAGKYRENREIGRFYSWNRSYAKNLSLLIGIDFQPLMIERSVELLANLRLGGLIGKRILPIVAAGQKFHLSLEKYKNALKVVSCVFQTLGNQKTAGLQVDLLKSMNELIEPNGKMIVSVFNRDEFDYGMKVFYPEVWPTVGDVLSTEEERKKGLLRTTRGVYSQWFSKHDVEQLFKEAGIHAVTKDVHSLPTFDEANESYLPLRDQLEVTKRAIIAEATA